ncbi:hypothetical protein [Streptomyces sp. NPDC048637]|uniref:hypothetical protein n=1 Tax=Streptomyces sp. NPDC048637 TaxID=3155636 RepID=UPI00342331AC
MDVLDTSAQLAELRARVDHILDRIAANSHLTAAGLGTLDPTALPSGYALQLALGPLDSLPARLAWGPHTPTDRAAVLDEVVKGVQAGVLSIETGRPDAYGRWISADATGDNSTVRNFLGLPAADTGMPSVPLHKVEVAGQPRSKDGD